MSINEKMNLEDGSITTRGIGEDASSPTVASKSPYSSNINVSKLDLHSTAIIIENPNYEVKFSGVDEEKDSIMSSSSSASSLSDITGKKKPNIPDGGWGWMVVLASMILSMIADGISFSFGLLYVEFLKEFNESKAKTAWIGSLFMAVPLMSGPVMSALVDRYGCRKMTIAGGLISATGFVISSRVNSIEVMYLTFGVLAGVGLGLCYVTAVVSIAFWFDKRRNLAVGLGACGTGIGTFVYAPLTQFFIDEFGWRGSTMLLAGTFLQMCVCGCLMRDPDWWIAEQNRNSSVGGSKSLKNASSCGSVSGRSVHPEEDHDFLGIEQIRNLLKNGRTPEYVLTMLGSNIQQKPPEVDHEAEHCRSVVDMPTFVKQSEKIPLEVLEALSANSRLYNVILENYPSLLLCRSTSDTGLNKIAGDTKALLARVPLKMSVKVKRAASPPIMSQAPPPYEPPVQQVNEPRAKNRVLPRDIQLAGDSIGIPLIDTPSSGKRTIPSPPWLQRQFSVNPNTNHYLKHIRLHRNSVMYRGAMLNIHKYRMRASSCPNIYKNSMTTLAKENQEKWYADVLETIRCMADFSMLLELHFLLTSISTILLFTWFIVPYFYLAEHLTRFGYSESDSSKLLSVIGVTNTIGMIFLGWAGDQPWMHVTKTYGCCLILSGLSTISMIHFCDNYPMLVASCALFGLFIASNFTFTPVILVELVPLDRFTTAYGLILLCQGIGNLLGPPLAGWIFDITGTWETSFTQAGIWIVVSGLLTLIIPYTTNRKIIGDGPLEKDADRDSSSS
ncbi:chaski [Carabus blaptoides fortunei]